MKKLSLDEVNELVSKLSAEEIQNLSDKEIVSMVMERPGHPGQYGFMLNPTYFASTDDMSQALYQLMQRLDKVVDIKEKIRQLEANELD